MKTARVLMVYYSRTGHTRRVAESIAEAIDCDIEAIADTDSRQGLAGFVRSLLDSLLQRPAHINPTQRDPAAYDVVLVGTPIWAGSISSPVRTWLQTHGAQVRQLALFCTLSGRMDERPAAQVEVLCGKKPRAVCALAEHELQSNPMVGICTRSFLRSAGLQDNMIAKAQMPLLELSIPHQVVNAKLIADVKPSPMEAFEMQQTAMSINNVSGP